MSVSRSIVIWRKNRMSKGKNIATDPLVIDDSNLSRAWARLILHILEGAGTEVAPLILSLTFEDGVIVQDESVRAELDRVLASKGKLLVDDVAFTIFPQRLWNMSRRDRH